MSSFTVHAIPSIKIIEENDNLVNIFLKSLKKQSLELLDEDILVIASKVVAMEENRVISLSEVSVTQEAEELAKKARVDPGFAQIALNECSYLYIDAVPGAITTISNVGLLANAGADQSNIGENRVILLPVDSNASAKRLHEAFKEQTGKDVNIIVADSRTMPMRLGTVGCALGTYGFKSVIDERGKKDLFSREMHITNRAIADQLATTAELWFGETDECIPFVLIRGYPIEKISSEQERDINSLITAESCMFIGPLLPFIKRKKGDN